MCPQVDYFVIGGDLNGHVGCMQDGYSCHRGNGYGTRNVDRHQILDFAEANNFIISNTIIKKHTSHLITYTSGDRTSQVDFILVRRSLPLNVLPYKIRCSLLTWRLAKAVVPCMDPAKIKWWKLSDHKADLVSRIVFSPVTTDGTWNTLCDSSTMAAKTTLGTIKPGRCRINKQAWLLTDVVEQKVWKKKAACKNWFVQKTNDNWKKYATAKREAKKAVAEAKAKHDQDLYVDTKRRWEYHIPD